MQCDICLKKKATVHLTEIVDEQMTELHLCEDCAREKSVQMEQQFGLADLLAGLSDFGYKSKEKNEVVLTCPSCGITYDDFKKLGRLGCSECYSAFKDQLAGLLKKIHGSNLHYGKSPGKVHAPGEKKEANLEDLKRALEHAINHENFERAAELRDKIRSFREKGEPKK